MPLMHSLACFTAPGQQNWVLGLLRAPGFLPTGRWAQANNPAVVPAVKQGCYIQYHRLFQVGCTVDGYICPPLPFVFKRVLEMFVLSFKWTDFTLAPDAAPHAPSTIHHHAPRTTSLIAYRTRWGPILSIGRTTGCRSFASSRVPPPGR